MDDVSSSLKGVDAVIHAAAPLPNKYLGNGKFDIQVINLFAVYVSDQKLTKNIYQGTINGAVNVIHQAEKAGIKRVVYTSSTVTLINERGTFNADDWNAITEEQTLSAPPFMQYVGAKVIAEKAVWKFSDENKHVDVTVGRYTFNFLRLLILTIYLVLPPYIFGPFAPGYVVPKPDYSALSTNIHFYHWLKREGRAFPGFGGNADVRDVARIHVGALTSPPESVVGRKRIPLASPYDGNYKVAIQLLEKERPELKDRLVDASSAPVFASDKVPVDWKRVEEVTGVKVDSYRTWRETVLDTMDSLISLEKGWLSKGYKVEIPELEDYGF